MRCSCRTRRNSSRSNRGMLTKAAPHQRAHPISRPKPYVWKNGSTAISRSSGPVGKTAFHWTRSAYQVAVSKHHALGQPGGPTGVGKGNHVSGRVDHDGWWGRPGGG